jgi:hypothetical protein
LTQVLDSGATLPDLGHPLSRYAEGAQQIATFATEFAGPIPSPGTRGRATFTPGGAGITVIEVDVHEFVTGALNRGDAALGFMLFSSRESLPSTTTDISLDCKMLVTPESLTVKSL